MSTTRISCRVNAPRERVPGVPPADNEAGWRSSLGKLAELVATREA